MGEGQGGGEKVPYLMPFAASPSPWPPPIKGGRKIYTLIYLSKVDNQIDKIVVFFFRLKKYVDTSGGLIYTRYFHFLGNGLTA